MDAQQEVAVKERPAVNNVYNMEQGVSVNGYIDVVIDGEKRQFQITVRNGMDVQQTVYLTEVLVESYRQLRKKYPLNGTDGAVQPTAQKVEHSNGDKAKRDYTKPVPQNELPEGLEGWTEDVFVQDFDEIVIEPQLDDKATVKFFKDGLKWPVGAPINKWKNDTVVRALEPLGEFDVTKPAKIRVAGEQYWVQGNSYKDQQGIDRHYKNLKLVQATL